MRYLREPPEDAKHRAFLVAELAGMNCPCGGRKQGGRSFCFKCYSRLPRDMRRALFRKIGNGYGQAYQAAYLYLNPPQGDSHEKRQENV